MSKKLPKPPHPDFSHILLSTPSQPHLDVPLSWSALNVRMFQRHSQFSLFTVLLGSTNLLFSSYTRRFLLFALKVSQQKLSPFTQLPNWETQVSPLTASSHIGDIQLSNPVDLALLSHKSIASCQCYCHWLNLTSTALHLDSCHGLLPALPASSLDPPGQPTWPSKENI